MDDKLTAVLTADYRPSLLHRPAWFEQGMPPFSLWTVEMMRMDPQIRLCQQVTEAALSQIKLRVVSKDSEAQAWAAEQFRRFWTRAIHKVAYGLWYTLSGGEVIYELEDGKFQFSGLRPVYASDLRILTKDGRLKAVRVKMSGIPTAGVVVENSGDITLKFPKGFVYVHDHEFSSWRGRSEFEGAYRPWYEKASKDGAIDIRRMWFYRNAFDGGTLTHPTGTYKDPADNVEKSNRDLARQIIEWRKTGAGVTLPAVFDPNTGQKLWEWTPPAIAGDPSQLLEYPKDLDIEIQHGFGIPDDVITQSAGATGAFNGRSIPMAAWLATRTRIVRAIVEDFRNQVIAPGAAYNFPGAKISVEDVEIDTSKIMPSQGGNAPQPDQPGGGPQEGQPPQGSQPPAGKSPVQMAMVEQLEDVRSNPSAAVDEPGAGVIGAPVRWDGEKFITALEPAGGVEG